jgi:hypothetical protein
VCLARLVAPREHVLRALVDGGRNGGLLAHSELPSLD